MTETSTDLIDISKITAVDIYEKDGGVDGVLNMVRKAVADFKPDLTTRQGRLDIKSIAARVAKSKTWLDGQGKEMVDEMKAVTGAIDAKRKTIRDTLDGIKKEVRRPLTEWEEAEATRVEGYQHRITDIEMVGTKALLDWDELPHTYLREKLAELQLIETGEDEWEEFSEKADEVVLAAIANVRLSLEKRDKSDAEKAESNRLREEAAERKKADDEAAAKKRQKERDAQVKADADERVAAAEKEAEEAKAEALRDAKERADAEQAEQEQAERKRAADEEHRNRVNAIAMDALLDVIPDFPNEWAKKVILTIASGRIPNVKITY